MNSEPKCRTDLLKDSDALSNRAYYMHNILKGIPSLDLYVRLYAFVPNLSFINDRTNETGKLSSSSLNFRN